MEINTFQQGGSTKNIQQQIIQLVKAAAAGDEKATQQINQIMDAAQKGDKQAMQIAQMIQQVVQAMKNQGIKAKYGAKLTQVRKLKGLCADDEELVYLKQGGRVCPVCQKKMKKNQNGDKLEKELSEIEKFKKQYKKDAKHPDEATKDSLLVNKYNDIEHLEKVEHKGSYVNGKWVPNRKNYSNKKQ